MECEETGLAGAAPPPGLFSAVDAGSNFACGVRVGGALVCWSWFNEQDLGLSELMYGGRLLGAPPVGAFTAVSAGAGSACGILVSGEVSCWLAAFGMGNHPRTVPSPEGAFVSVSVGEGYACGTRPRGAVACWGDARLSVSALGSGLWTLGVPATLRVPAATPSPEPPVVVDPPVPRNLRAGATTERSVALSWDAVSPVTRYDLETTDLGSNKSWVTDLGLRTSYKVPGLSESTTYRFKVRAVNRGRSSAWSASVKATTDASSLPPPVPLVLQLSGKVAVRRISPLGTAGYTLEYSFVPTGGSRILPNKRYVVFADLGAAWKQSSAVTGPTSRGDRRFGRIRTRRVTAGGNRIEVVFRTAGGSDIWPSPNRVVSFNAMTIDRWYKSSTITFTIPVSASARRVDAEGDAEDMLAAVAGVETGCVECFAEQADMEP